MITASKKLKFLFQLSKSNAIISRRFGSQGLGFGDIAVLYCISQAPDEKIRRVDLAEHLGLTASGVTRLLLPLEKIGVIKRQINKRDARVSYATLTPAGKTLLRESLESAEVACEDIIPAESVNMLKDFTELLANLK